MTSSSPSKNKNNEQIDYERRVHAEMLDGFDEELEMEIDDDRMNDLVAEATKSDTQHDLDRNFYFKELFRLQGELVKLQDWVVHKKLKVVVLFEGRDAEGKGALSNASPSDSIHVFAE
jgi:polyphosphate kinase 2 (PPK2 family)